MTEVDSLGKPFSDDDVEWRVQRSGWRDGKPWALVVAYIQARAIQKRLDQAVGPSKWKSSYREFGGGVICSLSVLCGNEWVTKEDGAPYTDIETLKGGISGAFKRAAVAWGMGRQLYEVEPIFAEFADRRGKDTISVRVKDPGGKDQNLYIHKPRLSMYLRGEAGIVEPAAEDKKTKKPEPPKVVAPKADPVPMAPELGETEIKVKGTHTGKKFKNMPLVELMDYAKGSEGWFRKHKKTIPPEWNSFFHDVYQYAHGIKLEPKESEQGSFSDSNETRIPSA